MITSVTSIVFDIHIAVSIAITFGVITALFSACTAVVRFVRSNFKQTRPIKNIEINIFNFYTAKAERFRQSKSLSGKKPEKIFKDNKLRLDWRNQ